MPSASGHAARIAIVSVVVLIAANAAFFFLSGSYFESHRQIVGGASVPTFSADQAAHVRAVFALTSGVVGAVNFAIALHRRLLGHVVAALLGAVNFVAGVATWMHGGASGALITTLLITGAALPVLAWHSYHRSRAAWAFLGALCSVLAVASLFGAPKIRGALDVSLWTTMVIPGLYIVAAVASHLLRDDYVDRAPATSGSARSAA
jgi:hypothetical protein